MRRTASADAIFRAFDERIDSWIGRNRGQLEETYRKSAGRQVPDSEMVPFFDALGDRLYEDMELDPGAVKRFVDFHASDQRLGSMADGLVEEAASQRIPMPPAHAASGPSELARRVAARWLGPA